MSLENIMGTLHQLQDQNLTLWGSSMNFLGHFSSMSFITFDSARIHMNPYLLMLFACQSINYASDLQWNIFWGLGIIGMWHKTFFGTIGPCTSIQSLFSLHEGNSTLSWYSYLYKMKSFLHELVFLYWILNSTNN